MHDDGYSTSASRRATTGRAARSSPRRLSRQQSTSSSKCRSRARARTGNRDGPDRASARAARRRDLDMRILKRHGLAVLMLTALAPASRAGPVGASGAPALEGAWAVARATMNGEPRTDAKVLNATWTFRGDELVVQTARGERLRAALSFDATAHPPAFHVTPLGPTRGDRPLWMIWVRRG